MEEKMDRKLSGHEDWLNELEKRVNDLEESGVQGNGMLNEAEIQMMINDKINYIFFRKSISDLI